MNSIPENNFPKRVTIELTSRCNLSCLFCPRQIFNTPQGDIDDELFMAIIDECSKNLPVTLAMFFRGEPLLFGKLPEFIKYAKEKGLGPVQLASNGLLLDSEAADSLLMSGLDFISFSLDTNDEGLYLQYRKNGNLIVSRKNILAFIKKADYLRSHGKQVPEIQISSVDMEKYRAKKDEFIEFWTKYADRVRIYEEHSADGNFGSLESKNCDASSSRTACNKVYSDIVIYYDGSVAICNHDWNNQMQLGNVKNQSIQEIWNGEKYQKLRRQHIENRFEDGNICKTCDHWRMYNTSEGFIGKLYLRQPLV